MRPTLPADELSCPNDLRTLIMRCWQHLASNRPSFSVCTAALSDPLVTPPLILLAVYYILYVYVTRVQCVDVNAVLGDAMELYSAAFANAICAKVQVLTKKRLKMCKYN